MNSKIILSLALLAFSCTLSPNYTRPKTTLPLTQKQSEKPQISKISWQNFFESDDLKRIIALALQNNNDLKIADLNTESAQATHGLARANLLPTISATGLETRQKAVSGFSSFMPKKQFRANLALTSFEIDFFGRLQSLKKSALEDFLASKQARNITKISLITSTANAYAQLLLDEELLKSSAENLETQQSIFEIKESRYQNRVESQDDFLLAKTSLENAKISFETYKKLVAQDKNTLMLLVGIFDENSLPKNTSFNDLKVNQDLLDSTPSEALLLRPDVQQAEHNLKSANANIGAARAAFFPSITLSGTYGYGSRELANLFDSRTWAFTPQVNIPIFSGGRNIANLKLANLRKKIEIAEYEKAIQVAFGEALDQFAEKESLTNQLKSFDKIIQSKQKSLQISEAKYQQGVSGNLEMLNAKTALLTAQQNQLISKKDSFANLVTLYKTLGGGSEIPEKE